MKYGSLFSGIGGFDLGFDAAGFDCCFQVEIEPSCISVLERHWPNVRRYTDVTRLEPAELESVDVIVGGFPCQDLSVAGKRAGLSGERSGLFFEFIRVTNETRPTYVVWENVPGLLSSNSRRDFATVISELERVGYCGAWTTLDARWFGLAQRRRRVFGVFALAGVGAERCAEILSLSSRMRRDSAPSREAGKRVAACPDGGAYADREAEHSRLVAGTLKQRGRGATDEVMDSLQTASTTSRALTACKTATGRLDPNEQEFIIAARTEPGEHLIAFCADDYAKMTFEQTDIARPLTNSPDRSRAAPIVTHALSAEGADASEDGTGRGTPLTLAFRACGQDGFIPSEIAPPIATTDGGGAGVPTVFESRFARNGRGAPAEIVPPWKAESGQTGKGDSAPLAAGAFGVRRLTPRECERLQGFPDGWTEALSDSARYRALGNAVAVPVATWIAKRIARIAQ